MPIKFSRDITEQDAERMVGMSAKQFLKLPEQKRNEILGNSSEFQHLSDDEKSRVMELLKTSDGKKSSGNLDILSLTPCSMNLQDGAFSLSQPSGTKMMSSESNYNSFKAELAKSGADVSKSTEADLQQKYLEFQRAMTSLSENTTILSILSTNGLNLNSLSSDEIIKTNLSVEACKTVVQKNLIGACQEYVVTAATVEHLGKSGSSPTLATTAHYNGSKDAYAIGKMGAEVFIHRSYDDYSKFKQAVRKNGMAGAKAFMQQIGMSYTINPSIDRAQIVMDYIISRLDAIRILKSLDKEEEASPSETKNEGEEENAAKLERKELKKLKKKKEGEA